MANTFTFANLTLTDTNIFGGINFTHDLNTGDEFSIGNTASASVKFVTDTQLPLYSKDSTNGTFTWTQNSVSRGRFYITEVTKNNGMYEVTAYDAMILADTSIDVLSLNFPLTVSAAATAIATYLGCTVSGTVYNGTMAATELDATMSIRKLLGHVAEASGASVKIDGSDHLCFMYYASSGITISASQFKENGLDTADYTCAVIDNVTIFDMAGVVCATSGAGTNSLFIQGNPFLYEATNTEAATILGLVDSFAYTPLRCDMFEENSLEVGTTATFGTALTLVMHIESSENGAIASSVGNDTRAELNKTIDVMVNQALSTATSAQAAVQNLNQYFWYKETGAEAGAHIAEIPKADFELNPAGGNLLSRSGGVYVRDGLDVLASFGADGIRLGENGVTNAIRMLPGEIAILTDQGVPFFHIKGTQTSVTSEAIVAGGRSNFDVSDSATLIGTIPNGTDINVRNVAFRWHVGDTPAPTITAPTGCTFDIIPASSGYCYARLQLPDLIFTYGTSAAHDYNVTLAYYYPSSTGQYSSNMKARVSYDGSRTIYISCTWQSGDLMIFTYGSYDDITAEITDAEAPSFTLGTRAGSDGALSLSSGLSLYASQDYQAAFGEYNENDQYGDYAIIVGNGTADNARSNALGITWDGNIHMALDTNAGSGTDYDITTALTALGWDSDVII